jgi:DNA-binding response OmpR family regulator
MVSVDQHVAVVRWPDDAEMRHALRARRLPRLLIVPVGATPPDDLDGLEDWVSARADASEIEARMAALATKADRASRGAPKVDDDDVLRHGEQWVPLGPIEARIARALTAHPGEVVARRALELAAWGDQSVRANTTDRLVHRLRAHAAAVGLTLVTVRGKGYVLEAR